ncbi:sulfatase [Stieleria sp. JC731]|uniref:sulfatase family protein n=1 Tax=Pirellulaceae TaxID=2691357 RepID=UPI001E58036A|nr:sulfatase [Stieleria sp. JC731]MCC9600075.1 sulfatase [Stieleria sp. JC731]
MTLVLRLAPSSPLVSIFSSALCLFLWATSATKAHAEQASRPNILFAIADDWSFGHASAYGCAWVNTPSFDRIAREGLLFNNAYTPNAKCAPSRAIILTGRYSWQLEEAGNHMCFFPAKFGGYVERLSESGYFTGYTGKGWGPGIANDADGNRRSITGKNFAKRKAKPPAAMISNNDYASNFADFLAESPADQPWAFWFGTTEPHRGYEYGAGVRLGKKLEDIDRVPSYWPDNETIRNDMLDYAVEVEHYDNHLGRILEHLEQAGQLDNTIVVATSDHGMPFPRAKGQAYDESNHIPLAIRWPAGIKHSGRVVGDFVDFTALAPTFLKAAGIEDPGPSMQPMTGRDLLDVFAADGPIADRDHVLVGKERHDIGRPNQGGYPIRGIRKGDWLYIRNYEVDRWPAGNPETGYLNCDGGPTKTEVLDLRRSGTATTFWRLCFGKRPQEELYHVGRDPDCVDNLVGNSDNAERLEQLRQQMETELTAQGDPRMQGNGSVFDNYEYTSPASDHFYERFMAGEDLKAGWVSPTDFEPLPDGVRGNSKSKKDEPDIEATVEAEAEQRSVGD